MSKYKLIIADYDGTLAGHDYTIPEKIKEAIKKWEHAGHDFSIATGRQFLMIKNECEDLEMRTPVIVRGGAEIVDPTTGKVIFTKQIDPETVTLLLQELLTHKFKVAIEKDDTIYANFLFAGSFTEIKRKPLEKFVPTSVPKVVVKATHEELVTRESEVERDIQHTFPNLHVVKSYTPLGFGWDITSLSATKHLATLELLKILHLKSEEVVGIGDGYNDFPLLEATGLKVAMGNAPDALKAIADMVVPSFKENGVAVLIEKLLSDK